MNQLYETDIIQWSATQARLLRERKFDELDLDNIIDEIESVAKTEIRHFEKALALFLYSLILSAHKESKAVNFHRELVFSELHCNPSFKRLLDDSDFIAGVWCDTQLMFYKDKESQSDFVPDLPERCPYTGKQILNILSISQNRFSNVWDAICDTPEEAEKMKFLSTMKARISDGDSIEDLLRDVPVSIKLTEKDLEWVKES